MAEWEELTREQQYRRNMLAIAAVLFGFLGLLACFYGLLLLLLWVFGG